MSKHTETPSQALPQLKPLVHSILSWAQRPSALAMALGAMPALALAAMPTGGKVVAGAATISNPDGSHTVVNQSSDKAVLNWQSFSIGEGGHVQFVQRDANSVALNRVVGSDPSSILGNLSANGQIFLVNQNGIFFGHSAKVDVAGIVATTLDIQDEDFMRGDYRFSRGANAPARATVINEGALNANGGYVVLAGDYAANKGVVQAQLGTVLLASGDSLTLQMAGSSLINYQVDKATVAHLAGVENSGQILANGGRVIMTADVAQDLAATVVNNSGLIQAQSAVEKNGAIYFEGSGGNVANSGTLDASAQAGANGGHVEIRSTHDIAHEAGSKIDVSGAGEGTSDAGSINTWADGTNRYTEGAQIAARGGAQGGNGGDVELSGNHVVNRSIVDLSAANGELGTLTLDPLAITIADGAGANSDDGATIFEQNLEAQLKVGNVSLLATGQDASITVGALSDGVLDGSNAGAGGSLTLRAEGGGNPTVSFADKTNTIKVDKAIAISTGDIEAPASGTIDVGHLDAGTRIDLDSGSIRAASLTVKKTIDTQSDNAFAISARATNGKLTVDNDVNLDVRNLSAGALSSTVTLRADNGDVNVGGAINANATGLGYYNYNWTTAGNDAPTYFGAQPWSLVSQADHPILATLNIQATGSVRAGAVNVLATDKNVAFDTTPGGYWQTASATQHNFWRPTGAKAAGTVNAGGSVAVDGKTSVKADGYATTSYSETESWRQMVDNFNYTSQNQTVRTNYGCLATTNGACTGGYGYRGSYVYTDNRMKGSATGNYIWEFGEYTSSLPATANDSPSRSGATDRAGGSAVTGMGYSGVAGMSAVLNVNASGSVSMNGLDVRSTNRSGTGSGSFSDTFWGKQDTANGLNGTSSSFTSGAREVDYYDTFQTGYSAATSTATANISAGDNASVTIGAHSDVVAEHTRIDAATNSLAGATMNVSAGSAGGQTGNGLISIAGGVNVQGASGNDVSLNIRNYDGNIDLNGAGSTVTNTYVGADARAQVQSDNGRIDTQGIAVSGGQAAFLDVTASAGITANGALRTDVSSSGSNGQADIRLNAGGAVSVQDIAATSAHGQLSGNGYNTNVDGGTASVSVQSNGGDIDLHGDVQATGYKSATVSVAASGAGAQLHTDSGTTVGATTTAGFYQSSDWYTYNQPAYLASTTLSADGGIDLHGDVNATLVNRNGNAYVGLATTGGKDAAITQDANTAIRADGARATVTIGAGSQSPYAGNGAALDLAGQVSAYATTDAAMITASGAGGTLHGLSATSSGNAASVTVNAVDADGVLRLDGTVGISANTNQNGAALSVYAAGAVDTQAAAISVRNDSYGANTGARATLNAGNGALQLGQTSVSAYNNAAVNATASGDLTANGAVTAAANGQSGYAGVSLVATGGSLDVANSVAATAFGGYGNANLTLNGANGLTVHANLSATALGGYASLGTSTGSNAATTLDAGATLQASGDSATMSVSTGALDLQGGLRANAINGVANVIVNGSAGSVAGIIASSTGASASVNVGAGNGALDLAGDVSVTGYTGATLSAGAQGDLTAHGQLNASQAGLFGTAQVNLTASSGALLVDTGSGVNASAGGLVGNASVNLGAATGLTVNADLAATALSGNASIDVSTAGTNGNDGAIVQAAGTAIAANGNHASANINAAGTLALAGTVDAYAGNGAADVILRGTAGSIHHAGANAGSSAATVIIETLAADGSLVLDGTIAASANTEGGNGAMLSISGAGAIDASAATLSANNAAGSASAQINAATGNLDLADVSVSGAHAFVNGTAGAALHAGGALSVSANAIGGQAQATLNAGGTASIGTGASIDAVAVNNEGTARISLSGASGVSVDGAVRASANASGGDAVVDLAASTGAIALGAALEARADDIATIGVQAGAGDIHLNANLDAQGGHYATVTAQAQDGGLTQAAGTRIGAGARAGGAQVNLTSGAAMQIGGDIAAAATADGSVNGLHTGSARIDIATTGGAASSITQSANSTITAAGLSSSLGITAGSFNPAGDIANSAAFQLDGSLNSLDAMGGARLFIAGASGKVHDFTVNATNAPAEATISAVRGDLTLDGTASVTGQAGGTTLRAETTGSLDTGAASVTVTNGGNGSDDYAEAVFTAYDGTATLGATTVQANGGAASLYATSAGALNLPANLSATSIANAASIDLSTTGGADATITQDAASAIAARGTNAWVGVSAGSLKAGERAAFALGGDVQALATNGVASLSIEGAGGSVHDFGANATNGSASATIAGVESGAGVVLDGNGQVGASSDDYLGAWLNVRSEGAFDTSGANLSASNAGINGGARADLHANGDAVFGATAVSGALLANLDTSASGELRVAGTLSATATGMAGTASVGVNADGQAIVEAAAGVTAQAIAQDGSAAANIGGAQGVSVQGGLQAIAANQATVNVLATGGDIALDGAVRALSARNAVVNVTALDGQLTQSAGGTVVSGAAFGTAQASLASSGAMLVNGDVSAVATTDGTANGQHTGSAVVDLTTTGGASASITQGADSTIEAVGRAARVTIQAGDSNMGHDISATAAFDLGGTLRAVDAIGGSSLVIGGASGRVHDFTVSAADAPASAVITAFNGDLVLDGTANVVANHASSTGASLRADASGSIDTSAAQISVANLSGDDGAGASAELYAQGGTKLGDIAVAAGAQAQLSAMAGADLDVVGRLSVAGTAAYGQGRADLTAANAVTVATTGVVNVTGGGSASLNLDGSHGINVDGSLNAYGNEANIGLLASGGDIALNGALAAHGQDRASIDATGGASLTQAAGSSVHSGATDGVAQVNFTSNGAMTIDGQLSAAATVDGTVDGAHSGAALIDLATVGGANASLTQGAGSTIEAVGVAARLDVAAGDRSPGENTAQGAVFMLDGSLRAIDDIGGSALNIAGASGSVHDFAVSAVDAAASARINAYNGNLVLNGAGSVTSAAGYSDGASLLASASGSLDASAAVLNVTNTGDSNDAGATASLAANGGNAVLGTVNVAGGSALLDVSATGNVNVTQALSSSASGEAGIKLAGDAGVSVQNALNASGDAAYIDVSSATGGIALGSNVTAMGGERGSIDVNAVEGSLTQAANTVVKSGATSGVAQIDLASKNAMTINGNVVAAATADGSTGGAHTGAALVNIATTGGANASIVQDKASTVEAVGRAARLDINAGGESIAQAASFKLDGTLRAIDAFDGASLNVTGASGSVHDFTVAAGSAGAQASITAVNGGLVLTGTGNVTGNTDANDGASLAVSASGSLDTTGITLNVANNSSEGGAQATLAANGGNAVLSAVNVAGASALLDVTATGNVNVTQGLSASASGEAGIKLAGDTGVSVQNALNASGDAAYIDVTSANGGISLGANVTAMGGERAGIEVNAVEGSLTQAANTVVKSSATSGVAQIDLVSKNAMTINGNVVAAATADGSSGGAHTGAALVNIATTGGANASIVQAKASTVEAVGRAARLDINAGGESVAQAASFKLDGTLRAIDAFDGASLNVTGASGSVHDFTVAAGSASAQATITAVNGGLVLTGAGNVTGNTDANDGASLAVSASGSLDTTGITLNVANTSSEGGAQATLAANGGNAVLGAMNVAGGSALLDVSATGNVNVTQGLSASASGEAGIKLAGDAGVSVQNALNASGDAAYIDVTSAKGGIALGSNVTAMGGERAGIEVTATEGSLTQAANTIIKSGATSGVAQIDLASKNAMTINGNVVAAATADGSTGGAHTGAALVNIATTGGASASIVQDKASTVEAVGRAARLDINAGSRNPGENIAQAAAFKLDGTLRAIDAFDGASLNVTGASGNMHDFTVAAGSASAHATITAVNGDLVLSGAGTVTGNSDAKDGASLKLSASGSLDTTGTKLTVANTSNGDAAGAQATLLASTGAAKLGVAKVTAQGGGTAALKATANTTMLVAGKLDAENLGLGAKAGSAAIALNTTGKTDLLSTITQNSGVTISAVTGGNAGNAGVDIQAGNCCNSAVELNDTVKAVVTGGTGNATIAVRGETVAVKDLTANVLATGTGNTMISLAAPGEVKLAGAIDSQAASATARAQVQLVSDTLSDGATFKLSKGNSHVQLTPFSTGKIIGVHSDKDFDETADVNYSLVTLKKFMNQGAELSFGGEYDRSAWIGADGEFCLPDMAAWASQLQHTGAIHVAGNGRLNLGDVKMVFDTTGITTYHDPKMSAWSVPTGRVATLVVPPSNVDRYLDRTDNTLQNMNKVVQDTAATSRSSGAAEAGQPVPRGTQISGKLFMDGNGVNMGSNDAASGSQADAQDLETKRRNNGDVTAL